jgi:hypothetical protein
LLLLLSSPFYYVLSKSRGFQVFFRGGYKLSPKTRSCSCFIIRYNIRYLIVSSVSVVPVLVLTVSVSLYLVVSYFSPTSSPASTRLALWLPLLGRHPCPFLRSCAPHERATRQTPKRKRLPPLKHGTPKHRQAFFPAHTREPTHHIHYEGALRVLVPASGCLRATGCGFRWNFGAGGDVLRCPRRSSLRVRLRGGPRDPVCLVPRIYTLYRRGPWFPRRVPCVSSSKMLRYGRSNNPRNFERRARRQRTSRNIKTQHLSATLTLPACLFTLRAGLASSARLDPSAACSLEIL